MHLDPPIILYPYCSFILYIALEVWSEMRIKKKSRSNKLAFVCTFFFPGERVQNRTIKIVKEESSLWMLLFTSNVSLEYTVSITQNQIIKFHGRIPETNVYVISFCSCFAGKWKPILPIILPSFSTLHKNNYISVTK